MRTKIVFILVLVAGISLAAGFAHGSGDMVYVSAGEFTMGMSVDDSMYECRKHYDDSYCKECKFRKEAPVHKVYVDDFYIDKHEVTHSEYDKCVKAGECDAAKKYPTMSSPSHPVTAVSWYDARNYCEWAGKRLPTEAEWEKAARGTDGRPYPWGHGFDGEYLNFCDKNCSGDHAHKDWDDGHRLTAPVGSYPMGASPCGALDMSGNAGEWVADRYDKYYYKDSPKKDPKGPDKGKDRVIRGGSYYSTSYFQRVTVRVGNYPSAKCPRTGFRCAKD